MTGNYGFAPTEKMLAPPSLAEMLDISERHLADVRREDPTFPAPVLLGTLPRWSPTVIRHWMTQQSQPVTCECSTSPTRAAKPVNTSTRRRTKAAPRVH